MNEAYKEIQNIKTKLDMLKHIISLEINGEQVYRRNDSEVMEENIYVTENERR
jgi:hypothetical protein